jgi:hypothetical protein
MECNIARQVITARDIQLFFGKGQRMSYKMIADMRKHYKKKRHQPVTIDEFCNYYNVKRVDLYNAIILGTKPKENKK